MNTVIPNEGKTLANNSWLNSGSNASENWVFKLFSNNFTPGNSATATDFTEATFTGYASVTVNASTWAASTITSNVAFSVSSATPTFTCTGGGGQTIYGWYAVGATSGKVRACANFDSPIAVVASSAIVLTPLQMELQTFH